MDAVLEQIVRSQVETYMMNTSKSTAGSYCNANNPDDGSSSSSSTTSSSSSKSYTPRKIKKVQVKWERYNPSREGYKIVKQKDGGGYRFIKVKVGTPLNFEELKYKALKLYFDQNDCNSYMEAESECMKSLCGPNGETLDEDEDLWAYIERKGLFLSKCWFVLSTKSVAYDHDNEYEEAGQETFNKQNDYVETFTENFCHAITEPKEISRRRICSVCHCSYIGNQCIICIQNNEYSASCIADSNLNLFGNLRKAIFKSIEKKKDSNFSWSFNSYGGNEPSNLNNASASSDVTDVVQHIAKIHRMTIKKDLMDLFITKQINVTDDIRYIWIDPRGQEENGAGSGVSRDIYSSFWNEVYNAYLYGEQERVPQVRHDLYKQEWRAIGMIILKGYVDTGYFSISLSRAFLCFCLFGEVPEELLISSFLKYLSSDESQLVTKAIGKNEGENVIHSDEFAEILEQFKCKTVVTESNVKTVIIELARQELVQKSHIIASSWEIAFSELKKKPEFSSMENIVKFYERLEPTTKKVVALFKNVHTSSSAEQDSFNYLKRYVRGLETIMLKKFRKFITGSDNMVVDTVEKIFTRPESNFSRRPVAHTCTPSLELPSTYNNYCELR
ncbi:uncharacterized protein LOC130625171 [Hydractinia symbiolongicarpus]|uniref:uncharacterized protein LOC130625171 n=1 Tax=Hydractinia symbiolongicarpus TaxID=13093 RepID=UPI0025517CD2|nr:uncharacterized protein LOC130625171 [Hydractinia symbiolongicarpus]